MADPNKRKVAAVQMGYDAGGRDATIEKALAFIDEATSKGEELRIFVDKT